MNANKVIHEAMGLCWHDWYKKVNFIEGHHCSLCDKYSPTKPNESHDKPDYTAPNSYCELMDWMREDTRPEQFCMWLDERYTFLTNITMAYELIGMSRQEQVTLIAEWIESEKL
jgi:hypothetical protein